MSYIFKQPCSTRRPHPRLVFVKDHSLAPGNAQRRKNPGKLAVELVHAGVAGIAMMEWEGIEMPGHLKMSRPVFSRRPCVNQYDSRVTVSSGKPLSANQKFNVIRRHSCLLHDCENLN